jgi:two-component system NtrC family response regulator/two-component system response regulator AtoC
MPEKQLRQRAFQDETIDELPTPPLIVNTIFTSPQNTIPVPQVVMLTADKSLESGIEAMRLGAYNYLTKPARRNEMEAVIIKAAEKRRLVSQNAGLRAAMRTWQQVNADGDFNTHAPASAISANSAYELPANNSNSLNLDSSAINHSSASVSEGILLSSPIEVVCQSDVMRGIVALAKSAARLDSTVLLTGESGVGKDVIARFIHAHGSRNEAPLLTVNCGALPEALFESEFFGHERGSFTGATQLKRGLLEAADAATFFLDEIGELPLTTQAKLLQFLETGGFRRVGATRERTADVRIIAATNRRLAEEVQAGRFRADLFYRLNVISLYIPPLRERPEDIPELIEHFLALYRRKFNRPQLNLTEAARRNLIERKWEGNIRELRNTLERAIALSTDNQIDALQLIVPEHNNARPPDQSLQTSSLTATKNDSPIIPLNEIERQHILQALSRMNGNRERTAVALGISARTLYRKLREYDIASGSFSTG